MTPMGTTGRNIRLGLLGLGARGYEQMKLLCAMEDVTIVGLYDRYEDRLKRAADYVEKHRGVRPVEAHADWEVLEMEDIEGAVIMTGWQSHIRLAVEALQAGKAPALGAGGAASLDECWQLVRTSQHIGIGVMLLEKCCYGKVEMTVLNMVRQGLFGELVHCRGAYAHDVREEIGQGDALRLDRLAHFLHRNGDLNPTHGLGPIAKYLNLNRGNRMTTLTAMASKARGQSAWLKENRPDAPHAQALFRQGDVVTTMIGCAGRETILLTHDCTLPRAYSGGGQVQGTKGIWMEDNRSIYVEGRSPHDPADWAHLWESDAPYMEEYTHPLWREYEAFGKRGGHGGLDYLALRAYVESLQENKPFPIDVYDTAS